MTVEIVQNAYVVSNLEEKCEELFACFGIGPFVEARGLVLGQHLYRGAPAPDIELDVAFAQSGNLNIEIIEVKSGGPSAFADTFKPGESGLHHVAYFCDNYEEERDRLVTLGFPVASEFAFGDNITISYVDTRQSLGHMVELYPRDPLLLGLYETVRNARDNWDSGALLQPWLPG